MVFNFLKRTKKDHLPEREVVQINGENIIFNSRGLIPVIIQKIEKKKTDRKSVV